MRGYVARAVIFLPLAISGPLGLDICLPGVPQMSRELGSLTGLTQWVISGFILCWSLSQLFFGPLADRLGTNRIFLCGGFIYSLAAMGVYFVDTIFWLIVLRLIQGCGAGAMSVSVSASVALRFHGASLGKVFSLLNGAIGLVPALAPVMGGVLITHYGWRSSFYFLSFFVLACVALCLWKPLSTANDIREKSTDFSLSISDVFSRYRTVLLNDEFRLGCFSASCGFATQLIFFSSSPIVLIESFNIPVDRFGYYFSVNAIAITFGSLLTARLLGRTKEIVLLYWGTGLLFMAMTGFIITVHFFEKSVWLYMLSATVGSLGFSVLISTGAAVALPPFKSLAGQACALMTALQMAFSSLVAAAVMTYWCNDWFSMISAYFILSTGLLVKLQHYQISYRHKRKFDMET